MLWITCCGGRLLNTREFHSWVSSLFCVCDIIISLDFPWWYLLYLVFKISFVSVESHAFLQRDNPSLWLRDACPVIPPKHLVEKCLPMRTTPLSCQMNCRVNTQQTVVHSPTGSPAFLCSTNPLAVLKRSLAGPVLQFLQTKVNKILPHICSSCMYTYNSWQKHKSWIKFLFLNQ